MSEWDPWKRLERERERRLWDPLARLEYEQRRMMEDPFYRFEKERERMQWDPYFRAERQMSDPLYRYEQEQQRLREDSWYREIHRREFGLEPMQSADPAYVQLRETGLGTRPEDYFNPEYRVYMDVIKRREEEERRVKESNEFMRRFFDPNWLTAEDIERQLKELEEKERRRKELEAISNRKSGGIFGFFKRLFGLF